LAPISLHHDYTDALRKLEEVFATAVGQEYHPIPRVPAMQPSTSVEPTDPTTIRTTPRMHQCVTRRKKPMDINPQAEESPMLPTIHKESAQGLARLQRRACTTQQLNSPTVLRRRTIRQYQSNHAVIQFVTPKPLPTDSLNYISNDKDNAYNIEQAQCRHTLTTTANACGISGHAVYHLVGQHVAACNNHFIPETLSRAQATYQHDIIFNHMANAVVHPVKQETNGNNLIAYPGELTTRMADLTNAKILWNSTLSTSGAKFSAIDIGNMYFQTPLDLFEYMRIKAELVLEEFKTLYKPHDKIHNGYIYM